MTKKYLYLFVALFSALAFVPEAQAMTCEYRVEQTIEYGTGKRSLDYFTFTEETTEQKLYLDAYIPTICDGATVSGGLPPIEWVHGGGFGGGRRNENGIVEIAKELAKNGFAVFSIDYRVVPNEKKKTTMPILESFSAAEREAMMKKISGSREPKTTDDVQNLYGALISVEDSLKAKQWITENASRFRIDPTRFGLMGGSAGAVSVLSQAYIADDLGFERGAVTAVVDMFGTTQPLSYMRSGEAPLLIIHGTEDKVVPYAESDKLLAAAGAVEIPAERITMKGAGHGYREADILHRKAEGTDEVIMSRVVKFFNQYLRCSPDTDASCLQSDVSPVMTDEVKNERIGLWHRLWNLVLRLFR